MFEKIVSPLLLLAAIHFLPAGAAAGEPAVRLQLGNGASAISGHFVGDDLWVSLAGGSAGASYHFRLADPDGETLGEARGKADAEGRVASLPLWTSSGVEGCDCRIPAPDFRRHFKTFQEAEQVLNGRELRIEVFDSEGGTVAEEPLPVLPSPVERVYFADVTGCPRGRFMIGEEIYLGFLHADHSQPTRYFYLTEYRHWAIGDSLLDLRGRPEILTLPDEGEHIIFLLDLTNVNFGGDSFDGIARRDDSVPNLIASDRTVLFPEIAGPPVGLIVTFDGCGPHPR